MKVGEELRQAAVELKANKKLAGRLRRRPPKDLDYRFQREHGRAFEEIDCLECANCCKTTSPIFRDIDIARLAKALHLRPAALIEKYLHLDAEGDYVLSTAPCPFLGEDNHCSVYADRPRACREYPHTDRKNMLGILALTVRNSLVCPAVGRILRNLRR